MHREGEVMQMVVFTVFGALIGLSVLLVTTNIVGVSSTEPTITKEKESVAEIRNLLLVESCDDALKGVEKPEEPASRSYQFSQLENLAIEGSSDSRVLRADFGDERIFDWELKKCRFEMEPDSVGSGSWKFTVKRQGGAPPEILLEAEKP